MPKLIENLRKTLLCRARETLLREGYGALTIRGVAQECGVAAGTVYNYFPSKLILAASVMAEDWQTALARMEASCAAADVGEALRILCREVTAFSDAYRSVWDGYAASGDAQGDFGARHRLLVRQLQACLLPALSRRGCADKEALALFLAENVLTCAGESELTEELLLRMAERLLPSPDEKARR